MRKISILLCSFLFATLISMLTISPAQAGIEGITWLKPYLQKGGGVVIYEHGSTASLLVTVTNDVMGAENGLNVSKIIISFGWGQNKTLDLSADIAQIADGGTEVFEVSFTASATETLTSEQAWDYTIYVEHVNATTGPTKIVGTEERTRGNLGAEYFVVYSTDQAEAWEAREMVERIASNRPFVDLSFNSTEAKLRVFEAENETSNGDALYQRGDFVEAKAHYNAALILYNVAYSAEETLGPTLDDLFIREIESRISNWEASASLAASFSTTSILLGSAVVLFGIGYVIKQLGTLRKPETEPVKK
jgi:hypothetical protein